MWEVKIEDKAAKIFEGNELTMEDKQVIHQWAKFVKKNGPHALEKFPQIWADHPLYGKWRGFRASSFSYKGRIIYKVQDKIVTVTVVRITVEHNYKKKE